MARMHHVESLLSSLNADEIKIAKKAIKGKMRNWIFDQFTQGLSNEMVSARFLAKFPDGKPARYYSHCNAIKEIALKAIVLEEKLNPKLQSFVGVNAVQFLIEKSQYSQARALIRKSISLSLHSEDYATLLLLVAEFWEIGTRTKPRGAKKVKKGKDKEEMEMARLEKIAHKNIAVLTNLQQLFQKIIDSSAQEIAVHAQNPLLVAKPPAGKRARMVYYQCL
ncbi:MAG TPA: hypothetical protein ENJ82_16815, partial [Bacteroidetes bacterium]|nr:hypothetical protein [Bacteroidota bacterium]